MAVPKKYIQTEDGLGNKKRLSAATSVGPTRSAMDGPLVYAAISVGGAMPPTKDLKQINRANSPGSRSGKQEGIAKKPYMDAQRAQWETYETPRAIKLSGPEPK